MLPLLAFAASASAPRERVLFTADWRFHRGDAPDAAGSLAYENIRPWVLATGTDLLNAGVPAAGRPARPTTGEEPGARVSFVQPGFDDTGWQRLNLPHDWAISGPFDQVLPGETGKLPWEGAGWYRKHFRLESAEAGTRVAIEFDGAMAYASVWLNGHYVGGWPYGYSSFQLDLTPYANLGGDNVLAVRLDNPPESSRWYPGSGLYRNVWLVKTGDVRVRSGGIFVTTPRIADDAALVNVDVYLENLADTKADLAITTRVFELDASGRRAAQPVAVSEPVGCDIPAPKTRQAMRANLVTVPQPRLWSVETPHRYVAETTVERDGRVADRVETTFGFRTAVLDADRGFLLNGRHVPLRGVCLHHDQGALGTAINPRALERQLEILRAMGCNAIRTSHNPPAPELLELCDRLGFLVFDESFDCWRRGKKWPAELKTGWEGPVFFDYAKVFDDWHERDLRAFIRRDRNHPSVVMWSIGNEILEQFYADGWQLATRLAGIVREEDRTRPIAAGFNGKDSGYTGFQTAVDAVGFNYKFFQYERFHRRHPTIPVFGAETSSVLSTRGEYFFPVSDDPTQGYANFQVTSYDLAHPEWANTPDTEFKALDQAPYAAGEFVWTGFDYLGEPTPYNSDASNLLNFSDPAERARAEKQLAELGRLPVPSRSSYFGIIDLAGFPKDRFYLYQARWRPDLPMAHLLPHWNWPERVGQVTPVHVYTSGDEAELFLNGVSLGRKKRGAFEYRLRWDDVVYQPGELKVVTYKAGQPWATAVQRTTGAPAKLLLAPDRATLRADGSDLSFVTVTVADRDGQLVPRTHNLVKFAVEGPAEIAAVDNGNPISFESFQASERKAFNGLALVILRTRAGQTGPITLRAVSDGLNAAEVKLDAK
ncbi:MAG TPA: beta-galactosidase GalB [Opitutaceae bacterium]|nr:beta-galactosidase GalB [Opitutaceae bacterium]